MIVYFCHDFQQQQKKKPVDNVILFPHLNVTTFWVSIANIYVLITAWFVLSNHVYYFLNIFRVLFVQNTVLFTFSYERLWQVFCTIEQKNQVLRSRNQVFQIGLSVWLAGISKTMTIKLINLVFQTKNLVFRIWLS